MISRSSASRDVFLRAARARSRFGADVIDVAKSTCPVIDLRVIAERHRWTGIR
jgi:hypothetical protein